MSKKSGSNHNSRGKSRRPAKPSRPGGNWPSKNSGKSSGGGRGNATPKK